MSDHGRQLPLSDEDILDITDEWHDGQYPGKELHEALGWTWEQYGDWLQDPKKVPGR